MIKNLKLSLTIILTTVTMLTAGPYSGTDFWLQQEEIPEGHKYRVGSAPEGHVMVPGQIRMTEHRPFFIRKTMVYHGLHSPGLIIRHPHSMM